MKFEPWRSELLMLPVRMRFHYNGHGLAWKVFTHMTRVERLLLYRLALQCPPGAVIVEIGSYLGASANFLAAAAQEIGQGFRVHCVDTWQNETMPEGKRETLNEFRYNTRRYAGYITIHQGVSDDIAEHFHQPIHLLFIDGDHSYEACRVDVERWVPKLTRGGILVMHDYAWALGVQQVVAEMVQPHQSQAGHVVDHTYWTRL